MRAWIGRSLLLIAVVHTVFGVLSFGGEARQVIHEGLFDTVRFDDASRRNVGFWFLVSGALLFVVGGLVDQSERRDVALPRFLPWALLALASVGSLMMPVSAFWLLFIPAVGSLARRRGRQSA